MSLTKKTFMTAETKFDRIIALQAEREDRLIKSLKEMRDACAVAMRVIAAAQLAVEHVHKICSQVCSGVFIVTVAQRKHRQ